MLTYFFIFKCHLNYAVFKVKVSYDFEKIYSNDTEAGLSTTDISLITYVGQRNKRHQEITVYLTKR